jgi:NitT/TauT family transport system substrate-binding protein
MTRMQGRRQPSKLNRSNHPGNQGREIGMQGRAVISRRRLAMTVALLPAAGIWPRLHAQMRIEKPRLSLAVGGKATFYHLPLTIAEQLGYFKSEGLNLDIVDFRDGETALQSVLREQAEIASGPFENTIKLQAKGQLYQAFVLQGRSPQIAFGVSKRRLPDYKVVAQLKGKNIGVSAPNSSTSLLASLVLARGGVRALDVTWVGVGTGSGALAALRAGQIDAICNTDPVMTVLEQRGEVRIISDTRTLKGTQELFGGPMPAGCLYASAGFVQKNPNTCQALTNAIVRSLKWLHTAGPADILKTVPEAYLLDDRALYLASFNKIRESISLDGMIGESAARTALTALASLDPAIKLQQIDLAKTYTNAFARRAKERFQA